MFGWACWDVLVVAVGELVRHGFSSTGERELATGEEAGVVVVVDDLHADNRKDRHACRDGDGDPPDSLAEVVAGHAEAWRLDVVVGDVVLEVGVVRRVSGRECRYFVVGCVLREDG